MQGIRTAHLCALVACAPVLLGVGSWGSRNVGPWLNNPTENGVTVAWETVKPSTTRVDYGPAADELTHMAVLPGLRRFHEVVLTGLQPNTTYFYKVTSLAGNGDVVLATPTKTFPTSRTPDQPFRFVFTAETHSDSLLRTASIRDFVNDIRGFGSHLVLNAGDHVNHGQELDQWQRFFYEAGPIIDRIPIMNAWGNHDDAAGAGSVDNEVALLYFDHPGNERYYSFSYGNTLFVALDMMWNYDGRSATAIAWLEQVLASASDGVNDPAFIVVYMHPPVYGANKYAGTCASAPQATQWVKDNLQALFEQYDVSIVFSGHEMMYARARVNGVAYVQVTSSDKLREILCTAPEVESIAMNPSIARVDVQCQQMTVEGFILDGLSVDNNWLLTTGRRVFDTFTIAARPNTDCSYAIDPTADAGVPQADASVAIDPDSGTSPPGADAAGNPSNPDDQPDAGCGCASSAGQRGGWFLLILVVVSLVRVRYNRRRCCRAC